MGLATQVLPGSSGNGDTQGGCGMPGPARVIHHAASHGHHIGLSGNDNARCQLRLRAKAHSYDGHAVNSLLDRLGQMHLIAGGKAYFLLGGQPTAGNVDKGATGLFEPLRQHCAFLHIPATRGEVCT